MLWSKVKAVLRKPPSDDLLDETLRLVNDHFEQQHNLARNVLGADNNALDLLEDRSRLFAIESPFMWGWHYGHHKKIEMATPASGRASIGMMHYLMKIHGMSFTNAKAEGRSLDAMWNEADKILEPIFVVGERSFHSPHTPYLANAVAAFSEAAARTKAAR